jgi:hypothetical protein
MRKDGHTDVASSRRMCKTIIEDANDILDALPRDMEASLPTWWTNKLAKVSAYINGARDYLVYSESPMEEPREEMQEDNVMPKASNGQVMVGDYQTKHFDICPTAQELYTGISEKTDMVHLVVESAMLHDLFFKIEKQAIAMDKADDDMVRKAQHYADMIMELAEEMELSDEHSYIEDVHMAKIKELAEEEIEDDEEDEDDDNDMTPPSVRMMNAS